ncbi:MAG: hypothetical protein LBM97_00720 [Candidatus Nomurabacteria bacterium]|jgi:hypothetical protein|nr:hypothetical protein [Candidatus Nomurabacteria bacterium]
MKTLKPPVKLRDGEQVVLTIRRAPMSLLMIWGAEILVISAIITLLILTGKSLDSDAAGQFMLLLIIILIPLALISGLVGTHINNSNILFITNQRAIYQVMPSLLSTQTKIINLSEIEDVSFLKSGILANLFNYGTLRLSTESDETTYLFPFCGTPTDEIETINDLISTNKQQFNR